MNTCVVYYSRDGNTEIASEYLAEKISAKPIKLIEKHNYKGPIGFIRGGFSASTSKSTEYKQSLFDEIAKYDRIILATPVWASKTTPAINAVLNNVDFTSKEIYVVTTQADPSFSGHEERAKFYKTFVENKLGKFLGCFALQGAAPGKIRPKSEIIAQVDKLVKIK